METVLDKRALVMQSGNKHKVAVFMVTYNQAQYIGQAIESVMMQETDFPFKLFIGEDCSTDETRDICLSYKDKYPDKIHLILNEKNIGVSHNALNVYKECFDYGDYIAMCEGDDYWTDSGKLRKQVNFLAANPDFSISFHPVKIVYEESREEEITNQNQTATTAFEDLALSNFIYTVSCVFRNNSLQFPDWYVKITAGDYLLHLLNAQHGKIGFINEVMAVYRVHKGGMWSMGNLADISAKWITVVKECRKHFYPRGKKQFARNLARSYQQLCFAYFEANRYKDFRRNLQAFIPLAGHLKGRSFLALGIRFFLSFAPSLAGMYKKTLASSKPTPGSSN
ncbi:MAG TPA: glycosyltransferase [Pyrinomonadaceae bacterium]|jgi:glycosyltransferase involved in cell wall biosynthesis